MTAGNNLLNLLDSFEVAYQGDFIDEAEGAAQAVRAAVAGSISDSTAAAIQRPFLREFCKSVIGRTDLASDGQMLYEMYRYYVDNGLRIQSRAITFANPSATGGNIGNSQVLRLTKDEYNFDIEAQYIDPKRLRCVADYQTGTDKGREIWQLLGGQRGRDALQRSGSGINTSLVGLSADDSVLDNASFGSFDDATNPSTISSWTSTATVNGTNYNFDSVNYFRPAPSEGTSPYALNIKASTTLSQKLSLRGTKLDLSRPYLMAVVWNRAVGAASGTLTIQMGAKSTAVAVAAQSGWQVTLVPSPIGQSCWYRQFAQDDLQCNIVWARTGGNLLVDEVLMVPGTQADGSWHWILPASVTAYTAHRVKDEFTWRDNQASFLGKIQYWLWRAWRAYLPHSNGSSITWADPT